MLKVYDSNYKFLTILDSSLKDIKVTDTLAQGVRTLEFKAPCRKLELESLIEENYIETSDYNYVIKEIVMNDNNFFTVYCIPNYEKLSSIYFSVFDCYQKNLEDAYTYCLKQTDWKLNYRPEDKTMVTYQTSNVTGLEMIREIAEDYNQELWFDTKTKTLNVYTRMGNSLGAYYSNELRLRLLKKQSNSYDYCTVLYPYGKDGLTIKTVNDNKTYLENYDYTVKRIEKVLINEDLERAEDLLKYAKLYLEEHSQPKASYELDLSSIGEVNLGDEIIIVDNLKKIKQKQRIVKMVKYPNEKEKSKLEISNLKEDFATSYLKELRTIKNDIKNVKEIIKKLN